MVTTPNLAADRAIRALGKNIELARRRRGFSQADLARIFHRSPPRRLFCHFDA